MEKESEYLNYYKIEELVSVPKVREGCHLQCILGKENHAGVKNDMPVQLHYECFKIRKETTVCKINSPV